jgi:hypothetical protein
LPVGTYSNNKYPYCLSFLERQDLKQHDIANMSLLSVVALTLTNFEYRTLDDRSSSVSSSGPGWNIQSALHRLEERTEMSLLKNMERTVLQSLNPACGMGSSTKRTRDVVVLMLDTRNPNAIPHLLLSAKANMMYAQKWKYDFCFARLVNATGSQVHHSVACSHPFSGAQQSSVWCKLQVIAAALDSGYQRVVYLDADAVITNVNLSLVDFLKRSENQVLSPAKSNLFYPSFSFAGLLRFVCALHFNFSALGQQVPSIVGGGVDIHNAIFVLPTDGENAPGHTSYESNCGIMLVGLIRKAKCCVLPLSQQLIGVLLDCR